MGSLTLILLPGMDGTGKLFAPFIRALPPSMPYRAVEYPTDRSLGYDELLPIVRQALPTDSPFAIVAESFSGPLALMIAAEKPARLQAVVLCASFVRSPLPLPAKFLDFAVRPAFVRFAPKFLVCRFLLGSSGDKQLRQLLAHAVDANAANVLAGRMRSILDVDVRSQLQKCSVPILYIRGKWDWIVGRRNVADVLAASPTTKTVELFAPHLVLQTEPVAAANAVMGFLETAMR